MATSKEGKQVVFGAPGFLFGHDTDRIGAYVRRIRKELQQRNRILLLNCKKKFARKWNIICRARIFCRLRCNFTLLTKA